MLVVALWLGNVLPAVDATLISTALPTIIGELGGLDLYGWVFAVNLLTFTTAVPIVGKLADLYGRKPFFLGGVVFYLVGHLLSGLVQNIEQLILCRALVGLGLGAILPMGLTIMGDAFPLAVRARIQWIFATTWLSASIICPALASIIILNAHWRIVFYLPAPLALMALFFLAREYQETVQRREHQIDFLGAFLLTGGIVSLLLALAPIGRGGALSVSSGGLLFLLAVTLLGLFAWNELKSKEPLLPLGIVFSRLVGLSVAMSFVTGLVQFGTNSYLPLYAQGAQGGTSANAAAVIAPLTIGWPIAAGVGGLLLMRLGFYRSIRFGMGVVFAALIALTFLTRTTPLPLEMLVMFIMGVGFGFANIAFQMAVQEVVEWHQRGIVTASVQFARTMGGSLGVAVMGAVLNLHMAPFLASEGSGDGRSVTSYLLDPAARASLSPGTLETLQSELASGLHTVFLMMLVFGLIGFISALAFPKASPVRGTRADGTPEPLAASPSDA